MSRQHAPQGNTRSHEQLFRMITVLVLALVVVKAVALGLNPHDRLAISDNDDIMRLLSIRDWLNGQSWYDMTQYRLVPPHGVELHWSRYVDLAIAGLIWPLSLFLPMAMAEGFALVVWPTLLLFALVLMTGRAARHMIGPIGGVVAMLGVVLWPVTGQTYFAPARIDHHNVQIVATTLMVLTLLMPGRALRLGLIGGAAAALSMAVGLEMLPTIAVAGLVLAGQTALLRNGAGRQLTGFSLALAFGSTLLFAGQTAPAAWAVTRCDELSAPFLALAGAGALVCTLFALIAPRLPGLALRLAMLGLLSAVAIGGLYPLLQPCLSGPYGALPVEVQQLITTRITEARPALGPLLAGDSMAFRFVFPALTTVALASAMWLVRLLRGTQDAETTRSLGILLIFGWLGVIASMFQIRLMLMGAAAIPLLTAYVLTPLLSSRKGREDTPAPGLAFIGGLAVTLMAPAIFGLVQTGISAANASSSGGLAGHVDITTCRTPDLVRSLDTVAPGLVLSSSNIGPPLLLLTHHTALSGPYHRSAEAMANGALPFDGDEANMRATLARTGADYLLLCRNGLYGYAGSFATRLAGGLKAPGLTPVSGPDPAFLMLRIEQP